MKPSPEGLFPEPERILLGPGDRVSVQTFWGQERGTVMRTTVDRDGYPLIELDMDCGDRITVNIARVQPA